MHVELFSLNTRFLCLPVKNTEKKFIHYHLLFSASVQYLAQHGVMYMPAAFVTEKLKRVRIPTQTNVAGDSQCTTAASRKYGCAVCYITNTTQGGLLLCSCTKAPKTEQKKRWVPLNFLLRYSGRQLLITARSPMPTNSSAHQKLKKKKKKSSLKYVSESH